VCKLTDHAPTGIVLADQRPLAIDLAPLGGIKQFDDQITVTGTGWTDPHGEVIGGRTEAGYRRTEQLPEAVAFGSGPLHQVEEIPQLWQQELQWPTETVTGTQGEKIFCAGVQVVDDAVGIDADDRGGDAAEDFGGLRYCAYGRTRGWATRGRGLTCGVIFPCVPCCT
jgi:hypothetical protein